MTTGQQTEQLSFPQAEYGSKKKQTRRDVFFAKMESVVPWERLIAVVEPHYPKSGKRGRPPIGLERMLRMYFVQQWYGVADEAEVNALLKERGFLMSHGTSIDATLIAAPSSTKNEKHERDPDMHQTKKGNQWYPSTSSGQALA